MNWNDYIYRGGGVLNVGDAAPVCGYPFDVEWYRAGNIGHYAADFARLLRSPRLLAFTICIPESR